MGEAEVCGDIDFPASQRQALLASLKQEKEATIAHLLDRQQWGSWHGSYPCPLCVNRVFSVKNRLMKHLSKDHSLEHCCVSSAQLRIIKALWAQKGARNTGNWVVGEVPDESQSDSMLKLSASIMRGMLKESPTFTSLRTTITHYDKIMLWAWTESGAKLVLRADASSLGLIRLSHQVACTEKFVELMLTWSLDPLTY